MLIWQNFKFWSTNICYCLLSAPQNQFKTEKKRVWLVNVFCWTNKRFIFSVKNKYSYFKIQNFVKLANHRMTYIRHKCYSENYLVNKVLMSMYGSFIFGLLSRQSLVKFFLELLTEIGWEFPLMLQCLFHHFDSPFFFLHYELKVDYLFRQLFRSLACQICNPRLKGLLLYCKVCWITAF